MREHRRVTPDQHERYSRQIRFEGIGERGQERLLAASVAVVGCGALGSFQAAALARAGCGHIVLIDRDFVETCNLQRQWLYDEADARDAMPKAVAAARHLARINSCVRVTPYIADLTAENAARLLEGVTLILDGTDNFETRYLINDFAVARGLPWVYGAAVGSYGLEMPIVPGTTACLNCVFPEIPAPGQPTCETAGIVNVATSVVASLQVADALKILCGQPVKPRIATIDVWSGELRQMSVPGPDAECRTCRHREFVHLNRPHRAPVTLCGRNAVQIHDHPGAVDLEDLGRRLAAAGNVRANQFALRLSVPPYELTVFTDGRAIVKGTSDTALARSLYARYIGS